MKSCIKRFFAVTVILAMLLVSLPANVFAAGDAMETAELQEEPVVDVPAAIPIPEIVEDIPTELIDIKKKHTRRKKIEVAEGQLSLFDLVA